MVYRKILPSPSLAVRSFVNLTSRGILSLRGHDCAQLLQGLITNDINELNDNKKLLSAYFLNPQGRILYDVFLYYGQNCEYYVECQNNFVEDLIKYLAKYRLRKNVIIESQPNIHVYSSSQDLAVKTIISGIDPRNQELGYRQITDSLIKGKDLEIGYTAQRYKIGIGEGPIDFPKGASLPLESNGDITNSISFTKGCYIGQELTSRTHHTGVVRKRLMPILFAKNIGSDITIAHGTDVLDAKSNKKCGVYRNKVGQHGIALLKIQESLDKTLVVHDLLGNVHELSTNKPDWWAEKHLHI